MQQGTTERRIGQPGQPGALTLRGVSKLYGDVVAVRDVDLEVRPGEFVTLLGPSGSGKTTTLRIIAGFTQPDDGTVVLDGQDLTRVPPHRRGVGMVFQNYALFPHMTVAGNIAFPLEMRRVPKAERAKLVEEALRLVRLEGLGDRYPRQLSGGQQQRVALARALVFHPSLLLMDEPLGALDKKLREALQLEVMRVSHQLGLTVVYVTHDQEEALVMSDRIAVYSHGRIAQIGTGEELYERPASLFVADFIGESNIFRGTLRPADGVVETELGPLRVQPEAWARDDLRAGGRGAVVVRPERMWIRAPEAPARETDAAALRGRIREVIYLGSTRKYVVELTPEVTATVRTQGRELDDVPTGPDVVVGWDVHDGVVLPDAGEETAAEEAEEAPAPVIH
jgi:putative spermidine/putrescine transport system ATP-binding protein